MVQFTVRNLVTSNGFFMPLAVIDVDLNNRQEVDKFFNLVREKGLSFEAPYHGDWR